MLRYANRFWLAALIVAWAVDFLFFSQTPGVSFLIWLLLALAAGLLLARGEGVRLSPLTWVLAGLLVLLSAIPFLRAEPFSAGMGTLLSIGGLILLAATFRTGNWLYNRTWDTIGELLGVMLASLFRPFDLFKAQPAQVEDGAPDAAGKRSFWRGAAPVLRGVLLAIPVVAVLAALLSSADLVFADRLKSLLSIFDIEKLPQYIFRLVYILILTYLFAGVYLHALLPGKAAARPDSSQPVVNPFLGWTETAIVLGAVVLLFAFFVALQFQYLFGGQANITAAGYTYSEYARRGFSELVAVAVLSLLLTLTLGSVARRETSGQRTAFTGMTVALLVLVLVILGSALQRLLLYEQAYGFTRLRTYTLIFIPWLALLLLAALGLELGHRGGRFGLALLIAIAGFGLTVEALNVDGFIARQNIERGLRGEEFDRAYLGELSTDAIPVMMRYFQQPGLDPVIRDGLGAELACQVQVMLSAPQRSWKAFTVSRSTAQQVLAGRDWKDYPVALRDGTYYVTVDKKQDACLRLYGMD
ncbi:MAG: DUF4153 domain-containing protein [Bellilinea sp.]